MAQIDQRFSSNCSAQIWSATIGLFAPSCTSDFSIVRTTFGKACGQTGYDGRADFNGDCVVDIIDYSLFRSNFGAAGAPP